MAEIIPTEDLKGRAINGLSKGGHRALFLAQTSGCLAVAGSMSVGLESHIAS